MTGRVDDVDLRLAVPDGRVLGEDRDALLALEVHRVEDALVDVLIRAERAGLPEERVHERRLPVVDVRDDRDVAELVAGRHADEASGASTASSRPDPMLRIDASTSSTGWSAGNGAFARLSAFEIWTRQPGFALAYAWAPVARTCAALRSPSSRAASGCVTL